MLYGVCWFHSRTRRRLLVPKTAKRSTPGKSPTKWSTTARLRESSDPIEERTKERKNERKMSVRQRRRLPLPVAAAYIIVSTIVYEYTETKACTFALRDGRGEQDAAIEVEGRRWGGEEGGREGGREGAGGKEGRERGYIYVSRPINLLVTCSTRRGRDWGLSGAGSARESNLDTFLFGIRTRALTLGEASKTWRRSEIRQACRMYRRGLVECTMQQDRVLG